MEKTKKVFNLIFFIVLFGYFIFHCSKGDEMRNHPKYTVGYTYSTHWAIKSGKQVKYYFYVNKDIIKGGEAFKSGVKLDSGRYLVKYDSLDPQYNTIFWEIAIPDSVTNIPSKGWKKTEIPFKIFDIEI